MNFFFLLLTHNGYVKDNGVSISLPSLSTVLIELTVRIIQTKIFEGRI